MSSKPAKRSVKIYGLWILIILIVVLIAMVFGFLIGYAVSIFSHPGDTSAAAKLGLKAGAMMSVAVLTIGMTSLLLKRTGVSPVVESVGAFAVGFAVMNGMKAWLDGLNDKIVSESVTGLLLGAIVGSAMFLIRKRGLSPSQADEVKRR